MVVLGPAGTGKSRLVAEAVAGLAGVAWVRATPAAAELPCGAFAHLLPDTAPGGNPLRWATAAITAPVLVVDDAQLLDPASAELLHRLALQGDRRLLVTVRTGERPPGAVVALWKDELLPRLELGPMPRAEAEAMLGAALPGRIEAGSLARVWETSRGNPLYLRELVLSGALRDVGGLWLWHGSLELSATLRETVAARIGDLTGDERDVLDLLAFGEPLGVSLLDAAATERLEDRQLVTVSRTGRRLEARLAHPLYGEEIRSRWGTLRTRSVLRRLIASVEPAGLRRREDVLRVAVWRLDADLAGEGEDHEHALMLRACGQARAVRDLALAERLARAAGGGRRARLALAGVLSYQERPEEAETIFAALWAEAPEDSMTAFECAVLRAQNLAWGSGRIDEALRVIAEARGIVTSPEYRQSISCFEISIRAVGGDLPGAVALMEETVVPGPQGVRGAGSLSAMRSGVLAIADAAGPALDAVRYALDLIATQPEAMPSITAQVLDAGTIAAIAGADLDLAEHYTERAEALGDWNRSVLQAAASAARNDRLRGRITGALHRVEEAALRLPAGRSASGGPCLGELAQAHALLGNVEAAEEALARAESAVLELGPPVTFPLRFAEIWTAAARGDLTAAVARAEALIDTPYIPFALFALHDLVRLGRPDLAVDGLAALAGNGPLAALFARHAAARTGADLLAVATEFDALGFLLFAAEAAAIAAVRLRAAGEPRRAQLAEQKARTLRHECQGARTPALSSLSTPDLTPRQREIALLAAGGLTNREIATRLFLSIRTVANTLLAVYEKTGVNDRAELGVLLRE
ncbi:LuxR family transcriptional regulator [Actinocorallia longicatena]|uniref:LuxR family transcriptional regulator n=2 Tax=Actinocorallia longicatena TaxID=111803 RepID=A0ABP6QFH1_9ACTN